MRARIPIGHRRLEEAALQNGYEADAKGKMVHPPDYEAQKARQDENLRGRFRDLTGVSLKDYRPPKFVKGK